MLSLFQRKRLLPAAPPAPVVALATGLMRPASAAALLATPRRQRLLEHIWQRTSLSRQQFASLYRTPIERYAALVQQFPASEAHHHAYAGGMLDHTLEVVAFALKLRQSHLLPPGAPPEIQLPQAEAWSAAAAYAALLHDIGKLAVDLHVEYANGDVWHPWHGPLDRPYRFRYRADREYRLHSAAVGLLYARVLDAKILDWLHGFPELWATLLYTLAGQPEHAGTLGELVRQADQASVAQALGGDPAKAITAPTHALPRKLLDGLRYLVREQLKLNQPQASDGWLTEDALWLVSKTVADKLRAYLLSQGMEGIPASNTVVFDVLQEHGLLQPTHAGKAIWRARVTADSGWSHPFTFLRLAPALIWDTDPRPAAFTGTVEPVRDEETGDAASAMSAATPASPAPSRSPMPANHRNVESAPPEELDALLTLLQNVPGPADLPRESPGCATPDASTPSASSPTPMPSPSPPPTPTPVAQPSGEHFLEWMSVRIHRRQLIINDARALVHTVDDTVYLVTPGLFQRYAQEHPQIAPLAKAENLQEWRWVQRRFERLQQHRKQRNGLNIWTCEVTGPRKSRRLHGYLLKDPAAVGLQDTANNPYLTLVDESLQASTS